jgi:hypothetical protein
MNKYLFFISLFFSTVLSATTIDNINGYWSPNCGGFGGSITIDTNNGVKIDVNSNNLLISAKLKKYDAGFYILFNDVEESNNEIINWEMISKSKPIAEFITNDNKATMKWFGFYDNKLRHYIWDKEADFVIAEDSKQIITLSRCDFSNK